MSFGGSEVRFSRSGRNLHEDVSMAISTNELWGKYLIQEITEDRRFGTE